MRLYNAIGGRPELLAQLDFRGLPIEPCAFIYEHLVGPSPAESTFAPNGPVDIMTWKGGPQEYMRRHKAWLASGSHNSIDVQISNPQYSGPAIINLEKWEPWWNPLSPAATRWRTHTHQTQPWLRGQDLEDFARSTYLYIAHWFWTETLKFCREQRPLAQWAYYRVPDRNYWAVQPHSKMNEALARLEATITDSLPVLEASDIIAPSLYTFYPSDRTGPDTDSPEANETYFREHCKQYTALGRQLSKPVYLHLWYHFHPGGGSGSWRDHYLGDLNTRNMLRVPAEEGVENFILWGSLLRPEQVAPLQAWLDQTFIPIAREYFGKPATLEDRVAVLERQMAAVKAQLAAPAAKEATA